MRKLLWLVIGIGLLSAQAVAQQVTGSITAAGTACGPTNCVLYPLPAGNNNSSGGVAIQVQGTFSATIQFEGSVDGTNFVSVFGVSLTTQASATSTTAEGVWQFSTAGISVVRVRASAYTSGTANISMQSAPASPGTTATASIGTATITIDTSALATSANQDTGNTQLIAISGKLPAALGAGGGLKVDGSGTALPVSGTVTVTDGAGALNTIVDSGTVTLVNTLTSITNPVTVTDGAGAFNVTVDSGTVTVSDGAGALNVICDSGCSATGNIQTINGTSIPGIGSGALAVSGIVSDGSTVLGAPVIVGGVSGTTVQQLELNNQAPAGTEYGVITRNIPSGTQTISDGAGALNVIVDSGTVTAVTAITDPVTVTDGAGALNTIVDSGTLTAVTSISNPVTVTDGAGSLNTIVDSGTLTAVTSITNAVTVTDGAGSLNTIVDSGTITAVTTVTNPVTVTDGAGALNVICDSGCTAGGSTIGAAVPATGNYIAANADSILRGVTATVFGTTGYAIDTNIAAGLGDDAAENQAPTTDPVPIGVVYRTSPPTLTAGNIGYARGDVNGNMIVVGNSATGAFASNLTQVGGTTAVAAATAGVLTTASAEVFNPTAALPGPARTVGQVVSLSVDTNGVLRVGQADCGDPGVTQSVAITTSGAGQTQLVALVSGQIIYVCGWDVMAGGTTNVNLSYGTGVQCGTGNAALTGAYPLIAQTGLVRANAGAIQTKTPVSNALCINNSAAVQISGMLTYVIRQ